MAKKIKSRYKQKAKIGDKVIAIESMFRTNGAPPIGIIKQIDNVCNLRDNNRSVNEYYVYWPVEKAWTRHDCYLVDTCQDIHSGVVLLTGTVKVLYG